ncbi:MAG TPA: major capsid protein [Bacteroidia bacterium]|jgi:hypothetical protein|nr:major capsid protein [Bacteroidia bacterium]
MVRKRKLTKKETWQSFLQQQQQMPIRIAKNQPEPAGSGEGGGPPPLSPELRDIQIPIDIGMYNTISVIEALKVRYPLPSFIKDMFFSARDYSPADVVQVDVKRGNRKLAPFVTPMEGQVVGRRRPFLRTFVEAPTLAPARVITLREVSRPFWGETNYDYYTPEERVANMFAEDTEDMDDEITRSEEWMCCRTMFYGNFDINYRTRSSVRVDYGFTNLTAVGDRWDNPGAMGDANVPNPFDDLHAAQQGLNENGYHGNVAIYGWKAWNALWKNPYVRDVMKNISMLTPVSSYRLPEALPAGVAQGPSFTYPVMDNYIYTGTVWNSATGRNEYLVPPDRVLIGSSDVKNRLVYAIVIQIEQADNKWHSYMADRVPKVEANVNKNFYMYTTTARPVPLPIDLLSWTVLTGVCAP